MNYLWKIVRTLMAIIGFLLIFGAAGKSDYYLIELGQPEPASVWTTITIGLLLMIPMGLHLAWGYIKENRQ